MSRGAGARRVGGAIVALALVVTAAGPSVAQLPHDAGPKHPRKTVRLAPAERLAEVTATCTACHAGWRFGPHP